MADKPKHQDEQPRAAPKGQGEPTYTAGQGAKLNQGPPAQPLEKGSQKGQIAQYFKSQGRHPDDVVWTVNGLNLTLKDLDG